MPTPTAAELLWGTRQRPTRGPKPSLSLERIIGEAIVLADAEGLANLSMQRLAERLGHTKMSLYRYVPGRAELVTLMVDFGLGVPFDFGATTAVAGEPCWRTRLRAWTIAIFVRFRTHPWSLEVTVGPRVFGPNELGWLEVALSALSASGLAAAERLDAVVLLTGHARNLARQTSTAPTAGTFEQRIAPGLADVLTTHGERYPEAVAAFTDPISSEPDEALRFGLERILDGLAVLIAERAR